MASELERAMAWMLKVEGLVPVETEHIFAAPRKWRYDFCWPEKKVALEVEGGTWVGGRHNRGYGFEEDCVKYNEAAILGWVVLRVTEAMVHDGRAVILVRRALDQHRQAWGK